MAENAIVSEFKKVVPSVEVENDEFGMKINALDEKLNSLGVFTFKKGTDVKSDGVKTALSALKGKVKKKKK